MAKILQGIGVEAISGTIGGTTFQKWRGLLIARGKPTPHNPQTARQTRIRSIVSTISRTWRDVLTIGQRVAWNQFAEVFPWFDVFGRSLSLTGISLFLKINTVLLDQDRSMQVTPPPNIVPPELTGLILAPDPNLFEVAVPHLVPGIITAQESFLDIWVAGGFTSAVLTPLDDISFTAAIQSLALPGGRLHQRSDFRHVLYMDDKPEAIPPGANNIAISPPLGTTRSVVLRVQRYNKFGRYSVPLIFNAIIETPL